PWHHGLAIILPVSRSTSLCAVCSSRDVTTPTTNLSWTTDSASDPHTECRRYDGAGGLRLRPSGPASGRYQRRRPILRYEVYYWRLLRDTRWRRSDRRSAEPARRARADLRRRQRALGVCRTGAGPSRPFTGRRSG